MAAAAAAAVSTRGRVEGNDRGRARAGITGTARGADARSADPAAAAYIRAGLGEGTRRRPGVRGPGGSNSAAAVAHARIGQQYCRGTTGGGGGKLASALGLAPRRRRQLF